MAQGPIPINDPPAPASVPGHLAKAAQIAGKNSFASLLAYSGLWCMGPTENRNAVVAIDVAARKELAKIPVGDNPKRNITMVMGGR